MTGAGRETLVAANWKMHHLRADAEAWCRAVRGGVAGRGPRVVVFPSFPLIPAVAAALAGSSIEAGGQDLHPEDKGAHTGDVSGAQLADAGCGWVLCGHSERRRDHGEPDELVARKALAAGRHGLAAMVCVGETRDERRAGRTFEVLERQVRAVMAALGTPHPPHPPGPPLPSARPAPRERGEEALPVRFVGGGSPLPEVGRAGGRGAGGEGPGVRGFALAYEPVWAIGTGETATPETAQEAHRFLRGLLAGLAGIGKEAEAVPLLYGGSVTPENAAGLTVQPDIDGFLVGGASLDPEKFLAIIRASG